MNSGRFDAAAKPASDPGPRERPLGSQRRRGNPLTAQVAPPPPPLTFLLWMRLMDAYGSAFQPYSKGAFFSVRVRGRFMGAPVLACPF